ncbi:MAG TPA: SGNH/GDSL hydrolase family protein [Streptosporangiaceae bacterium]|jgi:lysophospholipase L1-like esterase
MSPTGDKASADAPSKSPAGAHPSRAKAPIVMILGDSYSAGLRSVPAEQTYAADAARRMKWQVIIAGHEGTGFVTPGTIGKSFHTLFDEQLAWRPAPDMIVVSGGHNDWPHSFDQVRNAARQLLSEIKRRWPASHLVLMGPMWGSDPPPKGLQVRDALADVADGLHVPFIDPLAEQWITGDIHSGIGNAPQYIRRDGTHPNPVGNRYIADRFITDLRKLGLAHPKLGS